MSGREDGSAVMEAVVLGLGLLIPLLWLLTTLSSVHSAALATNSAVRETGVLVSRSIGGPEPAEVERTVAEALRNHGVDPDRSRIRMRTDSGFNRGARVEVIVAYDVALFEPPFLNASFGPSVTVRARHFARVDPFGSR